MEPINNIILATCPFCGSEKVENYLNVKDFFLTKENFSISACLGCGLKFTNPRPSDDKLSYYYQSEKYYSHSKTKNGLIPRLYQIIKKQNIKTKYHQIVPKNQTGHILDIGCGTGDFLFYCSQKSWKIAGVEPDIKAKKIAEELLGESIFSENETYHWADSTFDLITMWHVLEHVSDLNKQFNELNRLLKNGGTLVLALPNYMSDDACYYKEHWAAWDVPRHLYHFNVEIIEQIAKRFGFKLSNSLPMKWDSYYVSLLSEQSKDSVFPIFRASIRGFISNRKAAKSGEYSSKIYILVKK